MSATAIEPHRSFARFADFAADIKISHSVFALPWAILATFLAASGQPRGVPYIGQIGLILACMAFARTFAMAMNRALDARLDSANPRTARRAIPAGRLTTTYVAAAATVCAIGFLTACGGFWFGYENKLPLTIGPVILLVLGAYPLLKRFTRFCHYYLGACLALAPPCAWIAIRGDIAIAPLLMAAAVLLWTAGFDILYACQDVESDRATGVFSVPAQLGIHASLWVARLTHVFCVAALIALGAIVPQFGWIYFVAVAIAATLLAIEHSIVRENDLSKISLAFFTINGVISLVVGALGVVDIYF